MQAQGLHAWLLKISKNFSVFFFPSWYFGVVVRIVLFIYLFAWLIPLGWIFLEAPGCTHCSLKYLGGSLADREVGHRNSIRFLLLCQLELCYKRNNHLLSVLQMRGLSPWERAICPFPGDEPAEAAQKSRALRFSPVPFRNATQIPWLSGDLEGWGCGTRLQNARADVDCLSRWINSSCQSESQAYFHSTW